MRYCIILLLLVSTSSVFAQSYGDLKAAYDERGVYINTLKEKISLLTEQARLQQQDNDAKKRILSDALDQANCQTGLVQDTLAAVRRELELSQIDRKQLAADLRKYKPRTWLGRTIYKAQKPLAIVGAGLIGFYIFRLSLQF